MLADKKKGEEDSGRSKNGSNQINISTIFAFRHINMKPADRNRSQIELTAGWISIP